MKRIEIFRKGKQTAGSGETTDFTEDHLRRSVEAYDPKLHEAPIVVGHPRDNAPAYGWISALAFAEDGTLSADADQVMPEFAEMVQAGRFKKRSASFYKPDSPANPVPGTYYLRHVGFLGAQPPAVKGLADPTFAEAKVPDAVEFSDSPDDVVEFSDSYMVSTIFRRMREFFLERFGAEDADRVLPGFMIEDLEDEARRELEEPTPEPAYSEQNQPPKGAQSMTPEEIAALKAKAEKADALEAEVSSFKERETTIADREKRLARAEVEKSVDALITDGKVLPAKRASMIDYLESLDDKAELEFSEGEGDKAKTTKLSQRAFMIEHLASQPPAVEFGEFSGQGSDFNPDEVDFAEIAEEAKAYQASKRSAGIHLTTSQAVDAVRSGKHKQQ